MSVSVSGGSSQTVSKNAVSVTNTTSVVVTPQGISTTTATTSASGNLVCTTPGLLSTIRAATAGSSNMPTVATVATSGGTRTTLALQDLQGRGTSQATVVSVSSLAQIQAAKLTSLTSQAQQKG